MVTLLLFKCNDGLKVDSVDGGIATVVAALITVIGGGIGYAIKEFRGMREENRADHGKVMETLGAVKESVDTVAERLDDHIEWHLKK